MPNEFRMGIANEGEKELIRRVDKKDIPKAIMEKFDDNEGDHEMSYLPLKGYPAGHGIPGGTMGRSKQKMPKGKGSPLKGHLSEFDEHDNSEFEEHDFDDGGFFDEQEFSEDQLAEFQAAEHFQAFADQQQMMFSVLGAIAERLGMNFNEDGSYYFSDEEPEYPLSEFDEHGEGGSHFADKDNDKDDWDDDSDVRPPSEQKEPTAMKYEEFSDPALNSRITALEMREKKRNHSDSVNQLVDNYAAQLSEYHLDSEDVERMREIAFSSDNPKAALHQFAQVVAKNVPTDPPHTFTDYLSHESLGQNVPSEVQQFAEYGPDMYAAAESLWQPFQEYKSSTNSKIEFKDYVKAQGQLGSTTNTGEGV